MGCQICLPFLARPDFVLSVKEALVDRRYNGSHNISYTLHIGPHCSGRIAVSHQATEQVDHQMLALASGTTYVFAFRDTRSIFKVVKI